MWFAVVSQCLSFKQQSVTFDHLFCVKTEVVVGVNVEERATFFVNVCICLNLVKANKLTSFLVPDKIRYKSAGITYCSLVSGCQHET